jgi:hypothetical protein
MCEFEKLSSVENIHIIGNITKEGEKPLIVTDDGQGAELVAEGWEGF